jgi:peptidoglycan/xylan/chitin deacetylase (PgdA/CDA1 family)
MKGRDTLKDLYFRLLTLSGSDRRLLGNIRKQDLVVILNLHQVSSVSNPFWPPMKPEIFDELLGFLSRHFQVSVFRDLAAAEGNRPAAVLSFDDGYYNFVEYAAPILHKHGLAANLNVIPNCVLTGEPPWNIKLYDFLNSVPRKLINEIRIAGFDERLADDSADCKVRYGLKISRFLKNRPRRERMEVWSEVSGVMARASDLKPTRMMSASDIRDAATTHEIGVHSYSHESMEFEDEEFFEDDFRKCAGYFHEELRLPLQIYAFPNGSYRPEQITYLEKQGIRRILLVGEDYAERGLRVLPRFTVYGATPAEARMRALGYPRRPQSNNDRPWKTDN